MALVDMPAILPPLLDVLTLIKTLQKLRHDMMIMLNRDYTRISDDAVSCPQIAGHPNQGSRISEFSVLCSVRSIPKFCQTETKIAGLN